MNILTDENGNILVGQNGNAYAPTDRAIKYIEQSLTDEQKNQALNNLGVSNLVGIIDRLTGTISAENADWTTLITESIPPNSVAWLSGNIKCSQSFGDKLMVCRLTANLGVVDVRNSFAGGGGACVGSIVTTDNSSKTVKLEVYNGAGTVTTFVGRLQALIFKKAF